MAQRIEVDDLTRVVYKKGTMKTGFGYSQDHGQDHGKSLDLLLATLLLGRAGEA